MPTLIETSLLTVFVVVALESDAVRYGGRAPNTGILGRLAYSTVALILNLPSVVITFRYVREFTSWYETLSRVFQFHHYSI